ncbi:hypothetical protein WMF30_33395 [Sorangium sp. So ce134]
MMEKASPVRSEPPNAAKPRELGGRALLIGVEDYRAYDPAGHKNLPAGRNDVLAYWKVCRRLGYKPENIVVLTSPALEEHDLVWAELELAPELHSSETEEQVEARVKTWLSGERPKPDHKETKEQFEARFGRWLSGGRSTVFLGEATSWALTACAGWLAKSLMYIPLQPLDAPLLPEVALPGFFAYSGHGARRDGKLALCPSDVGADLGNAVELAGLGKIFGAADHDRSDHTSPTDNLTVVLDCCFAGTGDSSSRQRVPTLPPAGKRPEKGYVATPVEIGNRVFCASGPDELSYQAMLGGYWYGAFTWALTVALEQWRMESDGTCTESTISHIELLFRARMLLKALSFPQHPMLLDKRGIGNQRVFHSGRDDGKPPSPVPDASRPGGQLDPSDKAFVYYQFRTEQDKLLGDVIVVSGIKGEKFGFEKGKEYWRIHGSAFQSDQFPTVIVSKTPRDWPSHAADLNFQRKEASFYCALNPPASEWVTQPNSANRLDAHGSGFRADLALNGDAWAGSLDWVRPSTMAYVFAKLGADAPLRNTGIVSPSSRYYRASGSALKVDRNIRPNVLYRLRVEGAGYLASPDGSGYARWSKDAASCLVHAFGAFEDGSGACYIYRQEGNGRKYLNATKDNGCWYEDAARGDERFHLERLDGQTISRLADLRTGEQVLIRSDRQSSAQVKKYLAAPSSGYVTCETKQAGWPITWVVELA